jgi:hypothetical protein
MNIDFDDLIDAGVNRAGRAESAGSGKLAPAVTECGILELTSRNDSFTSYRGPKRMIHNLIYEGVLMGRASKVRFQATASASALRDAGRKRMLDRAIAAVAKDGSAVPGWSGSFYYDAQKNVVRICSGCEPQLTRRPWEFREDKLRKLKWQKRTAYKSVKKSLPKKR